MNKKAFSKLTVVVLDPESPPGVSLVGLDVDVEPVSGGDDEPRDVGHAAGQLGQHGRVGPGPVAHQQEVPVRLQLKVLDLQRDDPALGRRHRVEALQAAGVLVRVVGRRQGLRGGRGDEVSAAALRLRPPAGAEAALLHRPVRAELDHHEVGGRGERLRGVLLAVAAQRRDVHRGVLGPAAAQDLHGVEVALGVELGELEIEREGKL